MMMVVSQRIAQVMNRLAPVAQFFTASAYSRRADEPGICDFALVELPGYFRISLTANDTMIEQALPDFDAAL
jgi:hypothetical protein